MFKLWRYFARGPDLTRTSVKRNFSFVSSVTHCQNRTMRFIAFIVSVCLVPSVGYAAALTCAVNGENACALAEVKFAPIADDQFAKMYDGRAENFIAWFKPVAFYVQALTGLPMTVSIIQAGLASEYGASSAFVKHNNIFKFTCWQPKTALAGEVELGGKKFTYKGHCSDDKAAGQVGKIMHFASREESFYAYLGMLLNSHSPLYKPLQEHLKHAFVTLPARPASFRGVAPMVAQFSPDHNYVAAINRAVALYKIEENEAYPCWTCLRPPVAEAAKPKPAAVPAPTPATNPPASQAQGAGK